MSAQRDVKRLLPGARAAQHAPLLQRSAAAAEPRAGGALSGHDFGAVGVNSAASSNATIDVRATHLSALPDWPIYHLFLVYTMNGDPVFFRGGPGGTCANVPAGGHGTIQMTTGVYESGTVDWEPGAPSETVTESAGERERLCLSAEAARIDQTCTPYEALGPNSNTVAKTLLSKCGLPLRKPVTSAPGWGDPDL